MKVECPYCKEKYNVPVISKDWKSVIADSNVDAVCLATTEKLRKPVIEYAAQLTKKYNKDICEALGIDTAALESKGYVAIAD